MRWTAPWRVLGAGGGIRPGAGTVLVDVMSSPRTLPRPPRRLPRSARLALVLAATLLAAPAADAATPSPEARTFEFESLNRSYQMEDSEIAPVTRGGVTIDLTSPSNILVLRSHDLALIPLGDGTYRARVGIDFLGKGDLVADLSSGGRALSTLNDEVVVPRQSVVIDGRVSFERTATGWDITAHELPGQVQLDIRSRLIDQLYSTCASMSLFLGLDCDGLDRSLSRVDVPLPRPGSVFFLPASMLSPGEVELLDRYLGTAVAAR